MLISARDIHMRFGARTVLDNVSIEMRAGEIVTLIGPNGAGKSSLVRLLMGEYPPTSGEIARAPELRLGYVPQKLTIEGQMPLKVRRFMKLAGRKGYMAALELTGASALLDHEMSTLSGGELKRVLLAFALATQPNLLILDEPTAGLDQPAMIAFYALIEKLRSELGLAVLLVSHDLNVVMRASDRVLCLNTHLCCEGAPDDVTLAPEFKAMFGDAPVAFYQHAHTHTHDGGVCYHD